MFSHLQKGKIFFKYKSDSRFTTDAGFVLFRRQKDFHLVTYILVVNLNKMELQNMRNSFEKESAQKKFLFKPHTSTASFLLRSLWFFILVN